MSKQTRRKFLSAAGKAAALVGIGTMTTEQAFSAPAEKVFIHHVYFWLKNPGNEQDKQQLISGLKKLSKVKTIREFHIGVPAGTNREVVENSYAVSWMLFFKNRADQDSYQVDPIHLNFVETCSHLWEKVIVYDSIDI